MSPMRGAAPARSTRMVMWFLLCGLLVRAMAWRWRSEWWRGGPSPWRRVIGICETRCRQWCPASSGNLDDGVHGQAAEAASTRRPIHSGASKLSSMSMLTTRWSVMRFHRTRRSGVREDCIHWDLHCD
ncbi:hypothetical protein DAI22_08g069707 [Oryza sativa Japonica Group]|nr:hypothetical protein DAI22_08g069707 [Oryza sativa Japonica Group]